MTCLCMVPILDIAPLYTYNTYVVMETYDMSVSAAYFRHNAAFYI